LEKKEKKEGFPKYFSRPRWWKNPGPGCARSISVGTIAS